MKKMHVWEARLLRMLSLLPLSLVVFVADILARVFCLLPLSIATAYRVVLINTLICFPEKTLSEARAFARKSFIETARTLAGYSHVWGRPAEQTLARVRAVHGEEKWRKALSTGRPILYLSLHQSSWEVPVLVVGQNDPGALVMYKPAGNSALEELVKKGRQGTGCVLVPTNGEGVRAALSGLEKGVSMALLADHEPGGQSNPYVPFFGHEVMVPAFVHKVIRRYQPHVFFVSAQRTSDYYFDVWFEESDQELADKPEQEVLRHMMSGFERIISRDPTQYQWTYKRFKRGRNGPRYWYRKPEYLARVFAGESPADVFKS